MKWGLMFLSVMFMLLLALFLVSCSPRSDDWDSRFDQALLLPLNNDVH